MIVNKGDKEYCPGAADSCTADLCCESVAQCTQARTSSPMSFVDKFNCNSQPESSFNRGAGTYCSGKDFSTCDAATCCEVRAKCANDFDCTGEVDTPVNTKMTCLGNVSSCDSALCCKPTTTTTTTTRGIYYLSAYCKTGTGKTLSSLEECVSAIQHLPERGIYSGLRIWTLGPSQEFPYRCGFCGPLGGPCSGWNVFWNPGTSTTYKKPSTEVQAVCKSAPVAPIQYKAGSLTSCPAGYRQVSDEPACKGAAATAVNKPWHSAGSWTDRQNGCIIDYDDTGFSKVFFNSDDTSNSGGRLVCEANPCSVTDGSDVSESYPCQCGTDKLCDEENALCTSAESLCRVGFEAKTEVCPDNKAIAQESQCKIAAFSISRMFDRTVDAADQPKGCYQDGKGGVKWNSHASGQAGADSTRVCWKSPDGESKSTTGSAPASAGTTTTTTTSSSPGPSPGATTGSASGGSGGSSATTGQSSGGTGTGTTVAPGSGSGTTVAAGTGTTVPAGSGTTVAPPAPTVELVLTVSAVNFDQLSANTAMKAEVENGIKKSVAENAGTDIKEEHVQLVLSQGSVVATVTITPPSGVKAEGIATTLSTNDAALTKGIATQVKNVEDIDTVSSGTIEATVTTAPKVKTVVVVTTTVGDDIDESNGTHRFGVSIALLAMLSWIIC